MAGCAARPAGHRLRAPSPGNRRERSITPWPQFTAGAPREPLCCLLLASFQCTRVSQRTDFPYISRSGTTCLVERHTDTRTARAPPLPASRGKVMRRKQLPGWRPSSAPCRSRRVPAGRPPPCRTCSAVGASVGQREEPESRCTAAKKRSLSLWGGGKPASGLELDPVESERVEEGRQALHPEQTTGRASRPTPPPSRHRCPVVPRGLLCGALPCGAFRVLAAGPCLAAPCPVTHSRPRRPSHHRWLPPLAHTLRGAWPHRRRSATAGPGPFARAASCRRGCPPPPLLPLSPWGWVPARSTDRHDDCSLWHPARAGADVEGTHPAHMQAYRVGNRA